MATHKNRPIFITVFLAVLFVGALFFLQQWLALGSVTTDVPVAATDRFRTYTFFASSTDQILLGLNVATTTNATSTLVTPFFDSKNFKDNGYFVIAGAKRVTMFFARDDVAASTGTSTFKVEVTPDGVTWLPYNKLITNAANTNSQTPVRVASVDLASWSFNMTRGGTTTVTLDPTDSWYGVRCIVIEVTDGDHYCTATADW